MTNLHDLALNKKLKLHITHNTYLFQPEVFLNYIHLVQQILLVLIMEPEQFLKCSMDKNINTYIYESKTCPGYLRVFWPRYM